MKRREFIKTATGALALGLVGSRINLMASDAPKAATPQRWYKGNFHCHSHWSDGRDLPEVVIDAYKKRGYDFFSLTDHNILHQPELRFTGFGMNYTPSDLKFFDGETSFWKRIMPSYAWPNLVDEDVKRAQNIFGEDSVKLKETKDGVYVRMQTDDELSARFEEKDKFLMIRGFEMTAQNVHVNLLNVDKTFFIEDPSIKNLVAATYDKTLETYADADKPYLYTLNHPMWQYYNIQPTYILARPGIRFMEVTNNNTSWPYLPEAWTPEQLWDIVNACRAKNDQPLLYATGTDDSHGVFRDDYVPYHGWTRVLADALEIDAIFDALNRGASYISTGLEFACVRFDGKTLEVKLDPQVDGKYRIEFVGTKKGFDETFKVLEIDGADGRPPRSVECWSKELGKTLETVDGLEASYTLKPDDLYVRAKGYRVGAGSCYHGTSYDRSPLAADAAWTQPYRDGDSL